MSVAPFQPSFLRGETRSLMAVLLAFCVVYLLLYHGLYKATSRGERAERP
jgi:hypothetical protein